MKKLMFAVMFAAAGVALAGDFDNGIVYNLTFTEKYLFETGLNNKGIMTTKVVTDSLAGILVDYGDGVQKAYIWDKKGETSSYTNFFAAVPTVNKDGAITRVPVKRLYTVDDQCGFVLSNEFIAEDGKASASFSGDGSQVGAGTGTAGKTEKKGEYNYYRSIAGNTVNADDTTYGTWKLSYDAASTKLLNGKTSRQVVRYNPSTEKWEKVRVADAATVEEILAKKGVELVK